MHCRTWVLTAFSLYVYICRVLPEWRNWQTQGT